MNKITEQIKAALAARKRPVAGGKRYWTLADLAAAIPTQSSHLYACTGGSRDWGFETVDRIEAALKEDIRPGALLALVRRQQ